MVLLKLRCLLFKQCQICFLLCIQCKHQFGCEILCLQLLYQMLAEKLNDGFRRLLINAACMLFPVCRLSPSTRITKRSTGSFLFNDIRLISGLSLQKEGIRFFAMPLYIIQGLIRLCNQHIQRICFVPDTGTDTAMHGHIFLSDSD